MEKVANFDFIFFFVNFFLFHNFFYSSLAKKETLVPATQKNGVVFLLFLFVLFFFLVLFGFSTEFFFLPSFFFRFHRFPARCLSSHPRDYRVLPSFTEFYRVLRSCSNRASPSYSELSFRWLLASFTGFYRVFPFELYWDLADWVLMTLT